MDRRQIAAEDLPRPRNLYPLSRTSACRAGIRTDLCSSFVKSRDQWHAASFTIQRAGQATVPANRVEMGLWRHRLPDRTESVTKLPHPGCGWWEGDPKIAFRSNFPPRSAVVQ